MTGQELLILRITPWSGYALRRRLIPEDSSDRFLDGEEPALDIGLAKLDFAFARKPLLIGGKAMEFYGLRKAGADVDLVVPVEDHRRLAARYPDTLKDLWGDLGVCVHGFEIWTTICLFDYGFLAQGALEEPGFLVISMERLLFLKALAMGVEKYRKDLELIVRKISTEKYTAWWATLDPEERERRTKAGQAPAAP